MSAASATAIKSQTRLPHCRWTTVDACRPRGAPCRSARRCGPGTWRSSRGARGRHGSAASGTSGPPARRARFHRVRVARSGRRPPRPRLRGGRGRAAGRLRPALCERSFREPRRTHGAGGRATRRGIMRHKPADASLGGVPVLNVGEWAGPLPPPSIVCGGRAVQGRARRGRCVGGRIAEKGRAGLRGLRGTLLPTRTAAVSAATPIRHYLSASAEGGSIGRARRGPSAVGAVSR